MTALRDIRGTAFVRRSVPADWIELDSTRVDEPGRIDAGSILCDEPGCQPSACASESAETSADGVQVVRLSRHIARRDRSARWCACRH